MDMVDLTLGSTVADQPLHLGDPRWNLFVFALRLNHFSSWNFSRHLTGGWEVGCQPDC